MRDYFRNRQVLGGIRQLDVVVPSFFPKTGLVSYYKLDGNSNDAHGSNNGSDTSITYGTNYGKISQGALFNGSGSNITLTGAGTSLSLSGDFTLMAWVKLSGSGGRTIISKAVSNGASNNNYEFVVYDTKLLLAGVLGKHTVGSYTFSSNTWYQVCATKTGSNTVALYVNGVILSVTKPAGAETYSTNSTQPYIGRRDDGAGQGYFNGSIDEVGIWSRALTSDEISQLYNSGAGLAYN